ncbi:hypothetical protein Syun_025107 [Stephania yunnanensis]|uniref:Glycoside hydrolase family 31 TIM barrel domain-containing protein n=1 Tax=Stephania yunnanensis TaxID=152371 RepID=A0AAP0EU03_9MAGN
MGANVGTSDEEIYQYCLNLKEHVPSKRSTRLPSWSKHGQKFSDLDQRLVADCNLMDLDTAVVADRRGHFAVLSSKNHFEVCLVILYELLIQDRFPNPKALVNELHLNGFKAIWMLDLGIKHEEGYFVYDSCSKEDLIFPSTLEVSNLISASEEQYCKIRLGTQWLHSRVEMDGYEEYSEVEYSPAGCTGNILLLSEWRNLEQEGGDESLKLEGDIGGGLVLQRQISVPKNYPKLLHIDSGIIARNIGASSGGFSRFVLK